KFREKWMNETALTLMLKEPLLIRRPLLEVGEQREVGLMYKKLNAWIGLQAVDESLQEISDNLMKQDLQNCSHGHDHGHKHHKEGGCKH
ncbi:nitrogenase-associated protein, partial [Nostoc sp. HG1]|nr:nitrogenase-associated protein [Nostoc sp. HG1]